MASSTQSPSEHKMFGPLIFEDSTRSGLFPGENTDVTCVLCDNTFNICLRFDIFLKHLLEVHHLVIENVQNIRNLTDYLKFWKEKFKESPIEEIIPAVKVDSTNQMYFLMSTLSKEDKDLRHKLELDYVLKVQAFERSDGGYNRLCLFCKLSFEGTRQDFIDHLAKQHNLQLGNPQNLVFIEEMVEKIDQKLNNLLCLFCDRTFPDRAVLKEHMRKKIHKRINEKNTEFDKYYIVNYLESGKNWRTLQKESDRQVLETEKDSNSDEEYSDWNENGDLITCLFCDKTEHNINTLCLHMEADHEFDFADSMKTYDFYQKVKFVNFIRRQVHSNKCVFCDVGFGGKKQLQEHFFELQHCRVPEVKVFDQPEFYFPTYENDAFLYLIDDVEDV